MPELAVIGFIFLLGAVLGSFANVIIVRLPQKESIALPASHCRKCKTKISWYDNIPIFSYLLLRGRCRKCGQTFSLRYPVVELIMAVLFTLIYIKVGWRWILLEYLWFVFGLVTVTFIDLDLMILPDQFTLSGILIGLAGGLLNPERSFMDSFLGVLLGGGFLWAIAYIYWRLRKQEGMGGGDIKLLGWIGAVLGWRCIPFVIITSSVVGSIVGILLAIRSKKGLQQSIPFGPYLALAAIAYILLEAGRLSDWYLQLHGFGH